MTGANTTRNYTYPEAYNYTCEAGYDLIGTAEVSCQTDRNFSASPTCKAGLDVWFCAFTAGHKAANKTSNLREIMNLESKI